MTRPDPPLLEIDRLTVTVPGPRGPVAAVRGVSFTVARGEMVGLVGESGAGKSLTAFAVPRLLSAGVRVAGGRILLDGEDLLALPEPEMRRIRGRRVAMVFQEPMTALNPVFTIGFQVAEAVKAHRRLSRREARRRARELLERVALRSAGERLDAYPHELSGGERQRVVIAMALACRPDLLLADEPTTALDVTVQAQILDLLRSLRAELGLAVLLITHDLAVVAETCERVLVMYAGEIVEQAPAAALFSRPAHPYTRALLAAALRPEPSPARGGALARAELPALPGAPPDPADLPAGCPFHPRCAESWGACRETAPELWSAGEARSARCFLWRPDRSGAPAGAPAARPHAGAPGGPE